MQQDSSQWVWRRRGSGLVWHKLILPLSRASGAADPSAISAAATACRPQQGSPSFAAAATGKDKRRHSRRQWRHAVEAGGPAAQQTDHRAAAHSRSCSSFMAAAATVAGTPQLLILSLVTGMC